ncbi:PAS domain S-box protein [Sphingomonas floccifaciens]|uniref:PAS domain S-box protein n=1 Tax=Sphingomonas floccifaciens TaxID=1844115 RepID=A0ABW4N8C5_9SPHN
MARLLDGVILIDPTGTILSANPAALAMHGVQSVAEFGDTAEAYAERFTLWSADHRRLKRREYPLFNLLAGDDIADMIVEVAPAGEDEARWVHKVRDVVLDVDGGEPDYLALVLSDISQRFDAEARFKAMFQANPAPAIIVRLRDQRIVEANAGFLALTGFTPAQIIGKSIFGAGLFADLSDRHAVRRGIEAGEVVPQTDAELLVADGARRLVLFAGQPIDVTGDDALLLTFADLEPRRQAEASLAASERHLQAVFEMAPVPMATTRDADHRITTTNAAFRTLTGYGADILNHRTADEVALWESAERRAAVEADVARDGRVRDIDARLVSQSGTVIDCAVSAETISVDGTPCVLWIYQDVTERRRSEAELGTAIDEVLKDTSWLSRSILDKLATLRRPSSHPPAAELSPREREILELVCDALDDAAIAERLEISRNTVRNHVAKIYSKIGVNRRSGAVVWGRERGIGKQ